MTEVSLIGDEKQPSAADVLRASHKTIRGLVGRASIVQEFVNRESWAKVLSKPAAEGEHATDDPAEWFEFCFRKPIERLSARLLEVKLFPSGVWAQFTCDGVQPDPIGPATGKNQHVLGWVLANKICNNLFSVVALTLDAGDAISHETADALQRHAADRIIPFDCDQFLSKLSREYAIACQKLGAGPPNENIIAAAREPMPTVEVDLTPTVDSAARETEQADSPTGRQMDGDYLPEDTPSRIAKKLIMSARTFKRRVADGKIKAIKISDRRYRLHRSELPPTD